MPSAKQLLSAQNLDDVPLSVRIGSPSDESDEMVYQVAMKGFLPPATNYGVVFRVAFAPKLEEEEEPASQALSALPVDGMPTNLLLRFGYVIPPEQISESDDGVSISMTQTDIERVRFGAWVLLTNRGIRWHFAGDGAPQVHPGFEPNLGRGVRYLPYNDLRGPSSHNQITLSASGGTLDLDLFVFEVHGRFYGFGLSGGYAPENMRWYDFVRGATGS